MKSLISKKRLRKERKKEERRTKQSLDSPQTIEANKKIPLESTNICRQIIIVVPIFDLIFQSLSPMSYIYIIPSLVYEIKNCKLSMLFEVKNQFNKMFSLSSLSLHCTRHKNKTIIIGTITHITLKQILKFCMANLYIYNLALGRPDIFQDIQHRPGGVMILINYDFPFDCLPRKDSMQPKNTIYDIILQ